MPEDNSPPKGKKMLAALAASLVTGLAIVLQVDDWGRDLTQNTAATADDAPEGLRPLETSLSTPECVTLIKGAATGLPRWECVAEEGPTLSFVRTSGLFRFKDDITVRVEDAGDKRQIHATSASRLGHADFGQNPRNLRLLLRAIEAAERGKE
jgi:uncharacterized protein (DUF1499 family)